MAGGLRGMLNLLQYFPSVKNDKQRRVDRQLAILTAIAARDSGCQEVYRKWENQPKKIGFGIRNSADCHRY